MHHYRQAPPPHPSRMLHPQPETLSVSQATTAIDTMFPMEKIGNIYSC